MSRYIKRYMTIPVILLLAQNAQAVDLDNGKQLYEQHCTRCHTEEIFQRPQRLVNSREQLIERIKQCELSNELTWFEEEIEDVAAWLAQEFYKFPKSEI